METGILREQRVREPSRSCAGFMCALIRTNGDGLEATSLDLPRDCVWYRFERRAAGSPLPGVVDALVDLEPVTARDERRRRIPEDVVVDHRSGHGGFRARPESPGWSPGPDAAPVLVITALVVTVVPWTHRLDVGRRDASSARTPSATATSKCGGVDGTFATSRVAPRRSPRRRRWTCLPVSQP